MVPNKIQTRSKFIFKSIQVFIIALVLFASSVPVLAQSEYAQHNFSGTALPDYKSFVESVQNGEKGVLRGVYVPGVMALPIIQQPVGYPGYVSQNDNEITQFGMAAEAGNVGLLAHNFLSGAIFFNLSVGQEVRLVYGDGAVEYFVIDQVLKYQALDPYSTTSEFRDLDTNVTISAEELFRQVYRGDRHVTFQTCIEANGNGSWGRIFIIAKPKLFPHVQQKFIRDNLLPFLY